MSLLIVGYDEDIPYLYQCDPSVCVCVCVCVCGWVGVDGCGWVGGWICLCVSVYECGCGWMCG